MTVIGQYTVRVNFTITNATKRCKIHCYFTNHLETRTLDIIDAVVNSDNASYISMNESTSTLTPIPTRTVVQTTRSFTSPLYIQSTITINITRISSEHQVIAGINDNDNNNNNDNRINNSNGMIIALLSLVAILLIVGVLNLMFTIKNCKRQDQKCLSQ